MTVVSYEVVKIGLPMHHRCEYFTEWDQLTILIVWILKTVDTDLTSKSDFF